VQHQCSVCATKNEKNRGNSINVHTEEDDDDGDGDVDAEACHLSVVCHLTYM